MAIDPELLRRLYVEEGLTAEEIAARIGCAGNTILRRLRRLGIARRGRGPLPREGSYAPVAWTPEVAYAVGLIATDGNLARRKRQMSFVSKDIDQIETFRRCLGLRAPIFRVRSGSGRLHHKVQWCNSRLYHWLLGIGLRPAKSRTLGALAVPDEYFRDFFRGCIDGDGSIRTYVDRYNTFKKSSYVYTRLYLSLVSASPRFLEWVRATIHTLTDASGDMTVRRIPGRSDLWCLRYAKGESLRLLRWMYYAPDVPSLARKRERAEPFLPVRSPPPRRGPGRPMVI